MNGSEGSFQPNEGMEMKRNKRIQVLRGLAICAVIAIHTYAHGLAGVLIRPHVNFCVALFIFLSGYLTRMENDDWGAFFIKRIKKVLIPYFCWTLIYALANRHPDRIISYLATGKAAAPLYFIIVYIQFVLLTPMITRLIKSRFSWIAWLVCPITLAISRYLPALQGTNLGFPFPGTIFLPWFPFYYLGMILGNDYTKVKYKSRKKIIVIYMFTLMLSTAEGYLWFNIGNYEMATTQVRATSILSSFLFCLMAADYIQFERFFPAECLLYTLGDYSFGIMLNHVLVLKVLRYFAAPVMFFPVSTVLTIALSYGLAWTGKRALGQYGWILGV